MRRHLLRAVRAWARLPRGIAGNIVTALHGERRLSVQVNARIGAVVAAGARGHGQILGRAARCPARRHGEAGAGGLVGDVGAEEVG